MPTLLNYGSFYLRNPDLLETKDLVCDYFIMEKFDQNLSTYLLDFNHDKYKIIEAIEQILDAL